MHIFVFNHELVTIVQGCRLDTHQNLLPSGFRFADVDEMKARAFFFRVASFSYALHDGCSIKIELHNRWA